MNSSDFVEYFGKKFTIEQSDLDGVEIEIAFPSKKISIETKRTWEKSVKFHENKLVRIPKSSLYLTCGFRATNNENSKPGQKISTKDVSGVSW